MFIAAEVPGTGCDVTLERIKVAFIFIYIQIYLYLYGMIQIYLDLSK